MDDLFGDLDEKPQENKPRGGRRGRRGSTTTTNTSKPDNDDDLFSGLDFSKPADTNTSSDNGGGDTTHSSRSNSSSTHGGRGGRRRQLEDDDDDLFGDKPKGRSTQLSTATKPKEAAQKPPEPAKPVQKKEEDEFGGFDISGMYFGGSSTSEQETTAPSKSSSGGLNDYNPFGNEAARFTVVNNTSNTRQLDLNKKGPKKVKSKNKNTTKNTGPKWNRPTFDFADDDDLELDEEELGQGTIGNGNRAGIEKPELNSPGSDKDKWTDGIEPAAKKAAPPKKKKKKKKSQHVYSDDEDDDDGIPSF